MLRAFKALYIFAAFLVGGRILSSSCIAETSHRDTVANSENFILIPRTTSETLINHIVSLSPAERAYVASTLGNVATDHFSVVLPVLIALLEDRSEQVRAEAAGALVRIGEPSISPLLKSLAGADVIVDEQMRIGRHGQTNPNKSDYIAWILINIRTAIELPLVEFFRFNEKSVNETRTDNISDSRNIILYDSSTYNLEFLGFILKARGSRSFPAAIAFLEDKDSRVRSLGRAVVASRGEEGRDALPVLEKAIARTDKVSTDEIDETVQAASLIGEAAKPLLRRWLEQHPDPRVRIAAIKLITEDLDSVNALVRIINIDPDKDVKKEALQRLSRIEDLPDVALVPILALTENPEMRSVALKALTNVNADKSAWKQHIPSLVKLLDELPLDEGYEHEKPSYLLAQALARSGVQSRLAFDSLIQRISRQVSTGRSLDTDNFLRAAAVVRPYSRAVPVELLDNLLEEIRLNDVDSIYPILVQLYPQQAELSSKIQEQLRYGLERKLTQEIRENEVEKKKGGFFIYDADEYYLSDYMFAVASAIKILALTNPSFTKEVDLYLKEAQGKPKLKGKACDALALAIDQSNETATASKTSWQTKLVPIWERTCQRVRGPRPYVDREKLVSKILDEIRQAEKKEAESYKNSDFRQENWIITKITDSVLKYYLKEVITGAPNENDILLSLNAQADLCRTRILTEYIQNAALRDPSLGHQFGQQLPSLSWDRIANFINDLEQPYLLGDVSDTALELLKKIASDEKDFKSWRLRHVDDIEPVVEKLLKWAQPKQSELQAMFAQLVRSPEAKVRLATVKYIGIYSDFNASLDAVWPALLNDQSEEVSIASAEMIINSGDISQQWETASLIAIHHGLRKNIIDLLNEIADTLRPSTLMSAGGYEMPSFPWPPPRYANRAKFGQDIDLNLIGGDSATFESVHNRILAALRRIDPNFESGLFRVPGGFAMLTKVEQTDKDGQPLAERWLNYRRPPSSLSEYLVTLFLSPPGYYRTIAFVFTNQSNFNWSDKALPDFRDGDLTLPPEIAALPLSSRHSFVLVYAFERRDIGTPRPYTILSAAVHLSRSGLLKELQTE